MGRPLCLPKATTAPEKHQGEKGLPLDVNFDRNFQYFRHLGTIITVKMV